MIILGIDPGLATIGYGIIEKNKNGLNKKPVFVCLDYGLIETSSSQEKTQRLKKINNELSKLIKKHKPDVMAMETVYFFKNFKTAIPVSQAGGVILLTAAKNNLPVFSFTPLQVKMAVTGFGRAEKTEVQSKIKKLLGLKELPKADDAADALAVALTYIIKET